MKKNEKTFSPRLPMEAREKLRKAATHRDKKTYRRHEKHKGRQLPER
jgi:predicted DNA-binding protein